MKQLFKNIEMVKIFQKTSLGSVGLVVGGALTLTGIYAYGIGNATLNLAGLFYGVPVLLGGLALKVSELTPIPFSEPTSREILELREKQATSTQNQIREDVTRYRYGQEAHLDESLQRLGLAPTDEERPELVSIRETATEGAYTLILEFDSPLMSLENWQKRKEKIEKFFGPNIKAEITQPEEGEIDLALVFVATETEAQPVEA